MKAKRTVSSYVLLVGVMGLSIAGGVLAYQIYSAAVKSQVTTQQAEAIKPIDGSINQATIDNLKKRTVLNDSQMQLELEVVVTPEVEAATKTAELAPATEISLQEATPSAENKEINE